jgi:Zn-dependent metalloprotease
LNSIILRGSAAQRERALRTLSLNHGFDTARVGLDESLKPERQEQRIERSRRGLGLLKRVVGGTKNRTIYTANNGRKIPGTPVRSEFDGPTGDPAVDEAFNYMGTTWDFYAQVFSRDSIDDEGMALNGTVHYARNYDNAFWDGQRMVYGDGDGEQFTRFTVALDVIGHEMTHGVIQQEAGLIYWKQAGALNESLADVFGTMVKQFSLNQNVQQADWLIGQGLFMPQWTAQYPQDLAIRSLRAPGTAYNDPVLGKDPQPSSMQGYVDTVEDNGGVHINSGIPNHVFYLAAMAVGGYSWQTIGPVWYAALQDTALKPNAQFIDFARLTMVAAQTLDLSVNCPTANAIARSWAQVGIFV